MRPVYTAQPVAEKAEPKKALPLISLVGIIFTVLNLAGVGEGRTGFNGAVGSTWMQLIWAAIPSIILAIVPKDNSIWQLIANAFISILPKPNTPQPNVNPVSPQPSNADTIALATFKAMVPPDVRVRYGTWTDFFSDLLRVVMANPDTFKKVWDLFLEIIGLMRQNPPAGYTLVNPPLQPKI